MIGHPAFRTINAERLFQLFKYSVYALIFINVLYFIYDDIMATAHTFRDGISWSNVGDAFATSLDSISWLLLLLLFELETYVISDDRLKGRLKWMMSGFVAICYAVIVVAFIGYVDRMNMVYDFVPLAGAACDHVGSVLSYAIGFDDYAELTAASCGNISEGALYANHAVSILSNEDTLAMMKRLAMTDVVNAGAWLLVVVVLQVDVILQLKGELTRKLYTVNMFIKALVYGTLTFACIYWAILGAGLDFWDALLWLIAFVFIELNLFKWHENAESKEV